MNDENYSDEATRMLDEITAGMNNFTPLPTDVTTRYKEAEDTFYVQLRETQNMLSGMLATEDPKDIRAMASVSKDLLNNYNETVRLRKLNEIECGKYVPISVISLYQKDVFPAIAAGIDSLRMDILNNIKPGARPEFENAWKIGYKKFVAAIKEAAGKLEDYVEQARQEATGMIKKGADKVSERRRITAAEKRNKE